MYFVMIIQYSIYKKWNQFFRSGSTMTCHWYLNLDKEGVKFLSWVEIIKEDSLDLLEWSETL